MPEMGAFVGIYLVYPRQDQAWGLSIQSVISFTVSFS